MRETTPDHKIALTARGVEQAVEAGKEISRIMEQIPLGVSIMDGVETRQPRRVRAYVSPFARARQTFAGIQRHLAGYLEDVREDPRLREQEWGHLRLVADAERIDRERDAYGSFYYRIPDGESGGDVYDRCTGVLDTLHRDFEDPDYPGAALIVGHGFSIRILLMRWLHWTVEELEAKRNLRNCEVLQLGLVGSHYAPIEPFIGAKVAP